MGIDNLYSASTDLFGSWQILIRGRP